LSRFVCASVSGMALVKIAHLFFFETRNLQGREVLNVETTGKSAAQDIKCCWEISGRGLRKDFCDYEKN